MPGNDESKEFVPLKIAVLTVSDTRNLKDDKSGALLVQRIGAAGHLVAERSIVSDDIAADGLPVSGTSGAGASGAGASGTNASAAGSRQQH